jgi:RNA polymerase sigma-70 factor (ECF subfamily)
MDPVRRTELHRTQRAAVGDPAAQTWLAERLVGRVRRTSRAFLKSPADADDATQLALIAILKSAASFRGESSLETWASRIVLRTIFRFLRDRKRAATAAAASEPVEDRVAPPTSIVFEALPRDVREYLNELPEAQSTAILLHHALDHSIAEVAEMTHVSPDTVKGRLRLGTAALRKHVRQDIAIGRRRPS